jgi:heme exporter protein B
MTAFAALLRKDLRVELRTLRSLPAMALFSVTAFVIFRFGLDREQLDGELAAGVLVPTLLFAAILAINRLFVAEREEGGFDLVRLAPIDRTVLFAAKASALVIYLVALELIAVPIFALFFLDSASGLLPFALVLLLADIGLAATGTLISTIATMSTARDLLAPLILLPLLVPLVIAAAGAGSPPAVPTTGASARGWPCSASTIWFSSWSAMPPSTSCSTTRTIGWQVRCNR